MSNQKRQRLAAEAARILATEHQHSYRLAKEKAAARLGAPASRAILPSNAEIERELRTYQALYGGTERQEHLRRLRQTALRVMAFFQAFEPRLVGSVLEGTADADSRISLHVFSEDPDALPRFAMERHLEYHQEQRRVRWHDSDYRTLDLLVLEVDGVEVELCLLARVDRRQAPPSPIDGRPQRRASAARVRALINAEASELSTR